MIKRQGRGVKRDESAGSALAPFTALREVATTIEHEAIDMHPVNVIETFGAFKAWPEGRWVYAWGDTRAAAIEKLRIRQQEGWK